MKRGYFTSREYIAKKAKVTQEIKDSAERANQLKQIKRVKDD